MSAEVRHWQWFQLQPKEYPSLARIRLALEAKPILVQHQAVMRVMLFGSTATGMANFLSDINICLALGDELYKPMTVVKYTEKKLLDNGFKLGGPGGFNLFSLYEKYLFNPEYLRESRLASHIVKHGIDI